MSVTLLHDEEARLKALHRYEILDTDPEQEFDDIALLANSMCATPFAVISLLDQNRQWFKARIGIHENETSRMDVFREQGMWQAGVFVIKDALTDKQFAANPLVTGPHKIRFYAGAPLLLPDGYVLGMLCVMDQLPRELSIDQLTSLRVLGRHVVGQLDSRLGMINLRRMNGQLELTRNSLRESEEKFLQLAGNVDDVFWITSVDMKVKIYISPAFEKIWGRSVESVRAAPHIWIDTILPEDREHVLTEFNSLCEEKSSISVKYRIARPDGTIRWIHDRGFVIRDGSGHVIRFTGTASDITEQKRAEDALWESEERFSGAFEYAPIGMAIVWPDGHWVKVNRMLCTLVGYSEAELLSRTLQEITHPHDVDADVEIKRRLMAGEVRSCQVEKRYIHARGHIVSILLNVSLVRDGRGQPMYFVSQMLDITESKRIATELLESKRFLKSSLDALSSHIAILDEHGVIIEVNLAWENFGRQNSFLGSNIGVGQDYLAICDLAVGECSAEAIEVASGIRAVLAGHIKQFKLEYPCHSPSEKRWFVVRITRFDDDGPVRVVVAHENITDRKRVEDELKFNNLILTTQQEASIDGILVVDENAMIISFNRHFVEIWNIPPDVIAHRSDRLLLKFVTDQTVAPEEFRSRVDYLYEHRRETSSEEICLIDGRTFDRYSAPIFGTDDRYYGRVWYFRDITERKRIEAALFQSRKMETVGKLAGGVAHEFNSILTTIVGHSAFLLGNLTAGSPMANCADEINKAADRAAVLTRQLLAYGSKQFLQPETLDLNTVLAGMKDRLLRLVGGNVDLTIIPSPVLHSVRADADQIEQVILNIAINACDAMPGGGRLTLEIENVKIEAGREYKPGDYVKLAITDTGRGMSEDEMAHVFEPFYSTKEIGQGTGLGLSTCYGIINQSSGYISVHSEVGHGSTFNVYLPRADQSVKSTIRPAHVSEFPLGTDTILLVERDQVLRDMMATMLRRLGYTILTAANGVEALGVDLSYNKGTIDLLITDVDLLNVHDGDLSDHMLVRHLCTRQLFTSDDSGYAAIQQRSPGRSLARLQKPFTPTALANKIRDVLDA